MVVGIKDAAKCIGICIIACCAVLVCTMFLNFYLDVRQVGDQILSEPARIFYTAQVSTAKVVCAVSGGCLLATAVVMLLFYIKHYIDAHNRELGILKALGYSNWKVARHFWVFGVSIFLGAAVGFGGAFAIMPNFYALQNEDHILPDFAVQFHPSVLLYFVFVPAAVFAALAVFYAACQLKKPVMALLRDAQKEVRNTGRQKENDRPFLDGLRKSTLQTKKTLVFFVIFASFCFSAMTQMSASMRDLSSPMMGAMILVIGIILACTTLFLAIATVIEGNRKTIAMMRVFGYSQNECCRALLGGYRPMAYLGFVLGTAYQYALLRIMVDIVFRDVGSVPTYRFDVPVMLVCLAAFSVLYELTMYDCARRIKRVSVKEIMLA